MPVEKINKKGTITYEDHFLEIRIGYKENERFVAAISKKISEGWEVVSAMGVGQYLLAYMSRR